MFRINKIIDNPYWRLFIDLTQLLATWSFMYVGISKTYSLLKNSPVLTATLTLITFLLSIWNKNKFKEIIKKIKDQNIIKQAIEIQSKTNKDFITGIPSNTLLENWLESIRAKADLWDQSSILTGLNFYIDHGHNNFTNQTNGVVMQAYYYSDLKNLVCEFYLPDTNNTQTIEETAHLHKTEIKPFFTNFAGWEKALRKAYQTINDILPNKFKLQIYTSESEVHFIFNYIQGAVNKKERFEYNGTKLTNINNGRAIDL